MFSGVMTEQTPQQLLQWPFIQYEHPGEPVPEKHSITRYVYILRES